VLDDPLFDDPFVALGNLTEYRKLAKDRALAGQRMVS
jgi:hypothetical protein